MNNGSIAIGKDTIETKDKTFDHEIDNDLLAYSKKINQNAFVAFAFVILLNFIFFMMYCIVIGRIFLFPVTEYLYFDLKTDLFSLILYTINWILLISVITSQILLQEMHINVNCICRTVSMFFLLNLFGTINSIAIMYPIVTLLNYTYYYRFKSRITYFINNIISTYDTKADTNDKYLRLLAINHFLSKLCYKLQLYSLKKQKKKVNNVTIYDKLQLNLDKKLLNLDKKMNQGNAPNGGFRAESIYSSCVESELNKQRIYHRFTFRCYAIAINLSMIRLLFFSDGLDLYNNHTFVYYAFFSKLFIEFTGCLIICGMCYFDPKINKIKQNELRTRFYYIVLKSPNYKRINQLIYDHLLIECDKFYQVWKYKMDGPFITGMLKKHFGKDISGTINDFLFQINKHKKYHHNTLDIDPAFWLQIQTVLDKQTT